MILYLFSAFFILTEAVKQIILLMQEGGYDWWYFPFQLCSMPIYLLPLYLITGKKWIAAFLIDFSLLGGIFAFADQSGMHYTLPVLTFHSYLWHIMLIALGIWLCMKGHGDLKPKSYAGPALLFLFLAGIAECINVLLHPFGKIDMFYISPYYTMGQIVFRDFADRFGQNAGRLLYLAAILIGGFLIHLITGKIRDTLTRSAESC